MTPFPAATPTTHPAWTSALLRDLAVLPPNACRRLAPGVMAALVYVGCSDLALTLVPHLDAPRSPARGARGPAERSHAA